MNAVDPCEDPLVLIAHYLVFVFPALKYLSCKAGLISACSFKNDLLEEIAADYEHFKPHIALARDLGINENVLEMIVFVEFKDRSAAILFAVVIALAVYQSNIELPTPYAD